MTSYLVLDVFSETPFGGNQLAVIPDATALPEEALQKITREFNFSETTFVYPPADPAHTARVRIFTPTMEVPFAGHPTIGTAVALAMAGHGPDMVLELGVGPLNCHAENGAARFTTEAPLEILAEPDPALVTRALGLPPEKIATRAHPPVMATLGLPFTLTELTDRDALAAITTDIGAFREGAERYPGSLDFPQFVYIRDGDIIHARMFAPLDNIPEDPATGSAAATLAAYLARQDGRDVELTLHQGVDMGRPSVIGLRTQGDSVTVSGKAVLVMEGRLHLPN
ncbi:MAG: PhzF family phenazine biosynthesis protein [Thalassovita sp.]|nr:PhzF family phenazine biosynthesis protein [Thalassovita sp.]